MGDFKSKLPDLNELGSMTGKLYKGIKNSVKEIIEDYKKKRAQPESEPSKEATQPEAATSATVVTESKEDSKDKAAPKKDAAESKKES